MGAGPFRAANRLRDPNGGKRAQPPESRKTPPQVSMPGEAAVFLSPKPRNFQKGKFKFRSTPPGQLPLQEDLMKTIEWERSESGKYKALLRDIVTQLPMHGAYHRGQISITLKDKLPAPLDLDYIFTTWEPAG